VRAFRPVTASPPLLSSSSFLQRGYRVADLGEHRDCIGRSRDRRHRYRFSNGASIHFQGDTRVEPILFYMPGGATLSRTSEPPLAYLTCHRVYNGFPSYGIAATTDASPSAGLLFLGSRTLVNPRRKNGPTDALSY